MNRKNAQLYRRARMHVEGYATYGPQTKATLNIGRTTGLDYAGWREGEPVAKEDILAAVTRRRAKQIGPANVGFSVTMTEGKYKGSAERSVKVDIIYDKFAGETRKQFERNVKQLAQGVAADLAQREVIVEWQAPGKRGRVDTPSPPKAPSPKDKRFCAWVRENSRTARENPRDACFKKRR